MKNSRIVMGVLVVIGCLVLVRTAVGANGFLIRRSVVGGGGQITAGGGYILHGTVGEPVASGMQTGSTYGLSSGFWWQRDFRIYIPVVMKVYIAPL